MTIHYSSGNRNYQEVNSNLKNMTTKTPYQQPKINTINIDIDISLELQSEPPIGPGEEIEYGSILSPILKNDNITS